MPESTEDLRKAWALILANGPCRHEELRPAGFNGHTCAQCRQFFENDQEHQDAQAFLKRYDEAVDLVSTHLPDFNRKEG